MTATTFNRLRRRYYHRHEEAHATEAARRGPGARDLLPLALRPSSTTETIDTIIMPPLLLLFLPSSRRLPVALERERVAPLPGRVGRAALDVVGTVPALPQTTAGTTRRGEATQLAVLVRGVDDPVDAGVAADGLVGGVHQDHLVVLVGGVL